MSYAKYIQGLILREERQREAERQPASDVPYHGGRRDQTVQLQDGHSPAVVGREDGSCFGQERRSAENQPCGG